MTRSVRRDLKEKSLTQGITKSTLIKTSSSNDPEVQINFQGITSCIEHERV